MYWIDLAQNRNELGEGGAVVSTAGNLGVA
jgi:hypothetical protein